MFTFLCRPLSVALLAIGGLATGCAPSKLEPEHPNEHKGKMNAALFDTFTKGSLESNYEDILRTASLKIVGEKEVAKYTTVGSRGASTLYIWDIDDGKDGTSYLVFVGGSPRVITDSRVAIYDK